MSELAVTFGGIVHRDGCATLHRNTKTMPWVGGERLETDRACLRCDPDLTTPEARTGSGTEHEEGR